MWEEGKEGGAVMMMMKVEKGRRGDRKWMGRCVLER
jgi:hypothetical protein